MKYFNSVLIFLITLLITNIPVLSQGDELDDPNNPKVRSKPNYIGPVIGFNKSMHSVELKSFVEDPLCPVFKDGDQNGFYAGIAFQLMLGDAAVSNQGIIIRALYQTMPSILNVAGDRLPSKLDNGQVIESTVRHEVKVDYAMATIDAVYKFNFFEGFGITVGPSVDFLMTKKLSQKMILVEPLNAQFVTIEGEKKGYKYTDNNRTVIVKDSDIPESGSTRIALKAGAHYELSLGTFLVSPHLYYNFPLTKVTNAENWRVSAFQVGVDIFYALKF